ncbi:MAG: CsoS2 family carboxysome shell protein [Gammaproteobacteria bacterium]
MAVNSNANSARAVALERRKAMSQGGKAALGGKSNAAPSRPAATPPATAGSAATRRPARPATPSGSSAREASLERRKAMSTRGKSAVHTGDRTRTANDIPGGSMDAEVNPADDRKKGDCGCGCGGKGDCNDNKPVESSTAATSRPRNHRAPRKAIAQNPSKAAALARRRAQSIRGKAGISSSGMSEAQTARAANPQLSGRELAQALREQRSKRGSSGQKKSAPTGRRRKAKENAPGAASDQPWKVGASETVSGQTVTGTMVGRDVSVTGDEASTCRSITGTEYMGADIFREFCQSDPVASTSKKVTVTSTSHGNPVSGNQLGRASKVTGNEPGTCKNVTGDEYISAEQQQSYCGDIAQKSPRKPSMAETMKGKGVTGDQVGRSERVTGDEHGMNRVLTGTQYTAPQDIGGAPSKVGKSQTLRGGSVTGTMVGRRERMTGDEAGSCRNITGDDYIGEEQFTSFCSTKPEPQDRKVGVSKTAGGESVTGSMTGRSSRVTGDEPGTCKAVTGTPYAGSEQLDTYCEAPAADAAKKRTAPSRRNFGAQMTGQQPSVGGRMTGDEKGACETVSGTPYVGADQVAEACPATASEPGSAGPFGMAGGKVTGTEEARFGQGNLTPEPIQETVEEIDGRVKSRITGEGMDAGAKITGDDWERGDHVTGTEGASATRRNMTMRGSAPMGAMGARAAQPAEVPEPVSKVTGSSGNTGSGSLITYSGGARG